MERDNQRQNTMSFPSIYNIACAMGQKSVNTHIKEELDQHNSQIDFSCKSIKRRKARTFSLLCIPVYNP